MAVQSVTRFGLHGITAIPYGSFAGKVEQVIVAVTSGGGADPSDIQFGPIRSDDEEALILQIIRTFLARMS